MSTVSYAPVGYMPMPAGFAFKNLFERGKPRHDRSDPFRAASMKRSPQRKSRTSPGAIFPTRSGNGWMAGCRSSPASPSAQKPRREENAGRLSASHILFPAPTKTTLRTEQKGHTGPSQASCAVSTLSALRSTDSPFPWRMCRISLPRKSPDGSPPSGLPDFPES